MERRGQSGGRMTRTKIVKKQLNELKKGALQRKRK